MQNIPKIVPARLRQAAALGAHPDADLLTAFAEQSLGGSERDRVVRHLASCGDCREVVSLALPTGEALSPARAVHAGSPAWLSWPVLRWGVVAAGVALVTSAGVLEYGHRAQSSVALVSSGVSREQKVTAPKNQMTEPAITSQLFGPQDRETTKPAHETMTPPHPRAAGDQRTQSLSGPFPAPQAASRPNAGVGSGTGTGIGNGGGMGGGVFHSGADAAYAGNQAHGKFTLAPSAGSAEPATAQNPYAPNGAATRQGAIPPSSEMVEVQAEAAQLAQNQTPPAPKNEPLSNSDVVRAKDSVPEQAQAPSSAAAPAAFGSDKALEKVLRPFPRWTISPGGGLQRSLDGGMTWQDVNVNANADIDPSRKMKLRKKEQGNSGAVFRAVAALGPEVWAGGSGALLYHSLDSGNSWLQVVPTEANASISGDILSLEFSDAQHGKITTSAGEVWITGDDGLSWHKR